MYIPKNKARAVIDSISTKTGETPDVVMKKLMDKGHIFEGLNEKPLSPKAEALAGQLKQKRGGAIAGIKTAAAAEEKKPFTVDNAITNKLVDQGKLPQEQREGVLPTDTEKGIPAQQFQAMTPEAQSKFINQGGLINKPTVEEQGKRAFKETFVKSIKDSVVGGTKERISGAIEGFKESWQAGVDKAEEDFTQSVEALEAGDKGRAAIEFGSAIEGGVASGIKTFFSTIGGLIKPELETLIKGVDKGYTESIELIARNQGMSEEEAEAQAQRSKEHQIETFISKPKEQIFASIDVKADQIGQTMGWDQEQIDSAKDAFKNTAEAELNNILLKSTGKEVKNIKAGVADYKKQLKELFFSKQRGPSEFTRYAELLQELNPVKQKDILKSLATTTKEVGPALLRAGQNGLAKGELAIAGVTKSIKANRAAKEILKVEQAAEEAYNASVKITKPKAKEIMSAGDETRAIKALNDFIPEISEGVTGTPQQQATKAAGNIKSIIDENQQLTDALVERPTAQNIPVYKPLRILTDMLQEEKASVRPNSERLKMLEKAIEEEASFIEGKPLEISPKKAREIKRKIDDSINFDGKPFAQLTENEKLTQQRFKVQRDAYRQALDEALPETIAGRTFAEIDLDTAGLIDLSKVMKEEARRLGIKGDRNWAENALTFFEGKLGGISGKAAITLLGGAAGSTLGVPALLGAGLSVGAIQFLENRAALIASLKGKLKTILDAKKTKVDKTPKPKTKVNKTPVKKVKAVTKKSKPKAISKNTGIKLEESTIKAYGETDVPGDVAFVTSEGKLIDITDADHREIAAEALPGEVDSMKVVVKFQEQTGSIRTMIEDDTLNIEIVKLPTQKQLSSLSRLAKGRNVVVDITDKVTGEPIAAGTFNNLGEANIFFTKHFKPEATPKSAGVNNLKEEAKKFKTADEFIKSIKTDLITKTGGPAIIKSFHGTDKDFNKFEIQEKGVRFTGDGIYFTPSKSGAETFAGESGRVIESYLDLKNPLNIYLPEDNIDWQPDGQWVKEQIEKGYDSFVVRTKDTVTDDWVDEKGVLHKKGTVESDNINEIVVFDVNRIKTKSQLKDIWEEANK